MRRAAAGAAFLLVLGACSSSTSLTIAEPTTVPTADLVESTEPTPDLTPTPTETPERTAESPEPIPEPAAGFVLPIEQASVGGIITRLGYPLAVLAESDDGYVVRTPCGYSQTITGEGGELLRDIRVVLDPGHGGPIDTGAVGPNGLIERDLNMDLAVATKDLLDERGITSVLARVADYHTLLATRSELADSLGAEALVSIHHNAPSGFPSVTPGSEVFVQSDSPESRRLGEVMYAAIVDALATVEGVSWTTAADAGVLRVHLPEGGDAYGMIRRPATPATLLELGYLSNRSEAEYFATPDYLALAAEALADGIETYLDTDEPGRGWVDEPRVFDPALAPGQDVCDDPVLE